MTVPVALGVGTGSLSILPSLHPPFTILFTPHPAQSNPAPSAPQSQGVPSPAPAPPPSTTGVASILLLFFSFKKRERDLHLVPLLTPPSFLASFQQRKALHPQLQTCPVGSPWKSIGKKKTLGGHPVLPPRGQSILAGCLVAVVVGMPSLGTLRRHPTSDGEEPSPELVLPPILAPPVLGPPSSSLSSPKSLRPSLGDALAASSPKDWPHPSDGSRCVF